MKIIVIGAGTVGSAICTQLAGEGHDLTVIDTDATLLSELSNTSDVFGVVGNGADIAVLRRAGAEHANLVIAVTAGDELNILACTAARKLGARHTIARVRNPEYTELLQLLRSEMSLSLTINPELAAAKEISRMLRFPAAAKIDLFCRGRVELAEFVVTEGSPLSGVTLNELRARLEIGFLVCGVLRDGTTYIPSGDFRLEAGDLICVTAPEHDITRFFKAVGLYRNPVKDVLIVGGGRVTYYLEGLLAENRIASTVIEKDKDLCHELASAYRCTVVCDDGSKQETLLEQGLERADAFLALSDVDEENAIVSLYAKTQGVPKIVTMISRISYIDFFKSAGLESIVSPKSSTAAPILRYVRALAHAEDSDIETLHKLMDGTVEALEFIVKEEVEGLTDVPLREVALRHGVLVACIVHENEVTVPTGADCIRRGDTVVVITTSDQRMDSIGDVLK
ncbi:MAG: Trk system potassium transporter TrkA [Clostridia bacterium]|nr:Trk system potassium transporter TrkA [Clostridia bacterium]